MARRRVIDPERWHGLETYVRQLGDLLGLRDWQIVIHRQPPGNPEHQADVGIATNRKHATISFDRSWPDWTPEALRQTATHELVHLHLEALRCGLTPVGEHFSMLTWNVFYRFFERDLEYAVEAIAVAWSEMLPLPVILEESPDA